MHRTLIWLACLCCCLFIGYSPAAYAGKAGPEFRVNTKITGAQRNPSVARLASGGFLVTWESELQDGSGLGVYAQRYSASGGKRGKEFRVNSYRVSDQKRSRAAGLKGGGFVVIWSSGNQDGSDSGVYGQRYNSAGARLGVEFRVNATTIYSQVPGSVTGLDDGGFVVVWTGYDTQDGSSREIYGQRYDSTGTAQGAEFRVNTVTADIQDDASVAGLAGGGFVVVWMSQQEDGFGWGVFGQRYGSTGFAQGPSFMANEYVWDDQISPKVAGLIGGGFVVVWSSNWQDGSVKGVYGQVFSSIGSRVGREFFANSRRESNQHEAAVAGLNTGGFVVSWTSDRQDGSGTGVYARLFNDGGQQTSREFKVNTTTKRAQARSVAARLNNGNYVVVWDSDKQDGSGSGIFAQRFKPN